VTSVQAALNGMMVPFSTESRRGTLNLDASPLGLSVSELGRGPASGFNPGNAANGPNTNTMLVGNRIVVRAAAATGGTVTTALSGLVGGNAQQSVRTTSAGGQPKGDWGPPAA